MCANLGILGFAIDAFATNIRLKAERFILVTGASFIVFNGALKGASGLRGKSSIVEDGIMVQVSQERMLEFRKSLERMEDAEIECGPIGDGPPEEKVLIKWVNVDETVNAG